MKDSLFELLKNPKDFFLIAGPCLAENEDIVMKTAEELKGIASDLDLLLVFKSSYTKANRTALRSETGPGLDRGLKWLRQVKEQYGLPVITDVHETTEVDQVADVADIIQIPAFLCRQTGLLTKTGNSGRIVNIKKGQFMAPFDMKYAAEKVAATGNKKILLTERGTSFGYGDLVVDFRSFAILNQTGYPVVYDVTHSQQRPSGGDVTGGTTEFGELMARAALATGCVKGLFLETHPNPEKALSDSATQIRLDLVRKLVARLKSTFPDR